MEAPRESGWLITIGFLVRSSEATMRRFSLQRVGITFALALVSGPPVAFSVEEKQPGPNDVPQVVRALPEGDEGPASGTRSGVVKTIGPTSITVEFNEPLKELGYDMDRTGRLVRTMLDIYPPLPPKGLELTPDLRAGKCIDVPGFGTYRVSDVRVGDRVIVEYSRSKAGVWTCKNISIMRRPGARVPEAPADPSAPFRGHKWHEYCQARQDFEEKGTPIPLRFLPDYKERIAPEPRSLHAAPAPRVFEPKRIPQAQP